LFGFGLLYTYNDKTKEKNRFNYFFIRIFQLKGFGKTKKKMVSETPKGIRQTENNRKKFNKKTAPM
jgi:hypothetical protein